MVESIRRIFRRWKARAAALQDDVYALYLAYRHAGVPWYAKAWALIVAAYAFSPVDLVPDVIPVLGYLDDLVLVPLGVALASRLIPPAILEECRAEARRARAAGRPTNWTAGIIILLLWLMFLAIIAKAIWSILHR
ncbi:MAG: YkvA family protein [Anaerolineae bacterium]